MAKDRDDELNSGQSDQQEFSLEEILAEYGGSRKKKLGEDTIPFPVVPQTPRKPGSGRPAGKLVAFPGGETPAPAPAPEKRTEKKLTPEKAPPKEPAGRDGTGSDGAGARPVGRRLRQPDTEREEPPKEELTNVVDFPGESGPATDNPIAEKLNRLIQKADDYAQHMFEEEGAEKDEQVRRAERYIPGTDQEEEDRPRRERRPRRAPPPAPDLPPSTLFRRYGKGLKLLRLRTVLVFLLALPLLYLTLGSGLGAPMPPVLTPQVQILSLTGILAVAILLGIDVLARGLFRLLRMEMGMDTLLAFAAVATAADALTMQTLNAREGQMPYCVLTVLALALYMRGYYLKRRGLRSACRTAASAAHPYLVTLDEGKWNGRDTYAKWSGEPLGFGRQIQAPDGAERIFRVLCPLLFLASLLFSLISSVGTGRPENLLWCLSATLTTAASFSGALCFGIPWNTLCQRLAKSGAAIAGWDGVTGTRGSGILLQDTDLFPPGTVSLNGIKVFGDFSVDKVVSYTATLIRDSGSGLEKIFHDLLRSQGTVFRRAEELECHEGGGLSAVIRGEQVLVGSASFMQLMEVRLPQGLNVKNAVFCAVEGELAGIFALSYTLQGTIEPALIALIRNRIVPVLATRDFNLIPAMLRQRFKLPVDKMEFPPVERRVELSDENQEHSLILTAVLCREGVGPYSEAVVGSKRLRRAVRTSAVLSGMGSVVGLLLVFYLTFVASYSSLAPGNLLIFMLMWLVPTLFISGWVNRY